MAPQNNVGKDAYTVDLESNEKLYWLGTRSRVRTSRGLWF